MDDEIIQLLAKTQLTMFETTDVGLVVYIDAVKQWRLPDLISVYANPIASSLMPIEATGDWDKLPENSQTILQGARYIGREAYERGEIGFGPPMQYTTTNAHGESVHLEIKGMVPGETSNGRITVVTVHDITGRVFRERINGGGHAVSSASIHRLTDRERSIALLIVEGLSTKEIAIELGISHRTVENHRSNIRRKMNLADRTISISECLSIL